MEDMTIEGVGVMAVGRELEQSRVDTFHQRQGFGEQEQPDIVLLARLNPSDERVIEQGDLHSERVFSCLLHPLRC